MWGVIPQHVPTVMATIGLFFIMNRLHALDKQRIIDTIGADIVSDVMHASDSSAPEASACMSIQEAVEDTRFVPKSKEGRVSHRKLGRRAMTKMQTAASLETVYLLMEGCQDRLNYSCVNWQYLWVHFLVFSLFEILITMTHVRLVIVGEVALDRDGLLEIAFDVFHGSIGFFTLIGCLVTPALVTSSYGELPTSVGLSLRAQGLPTHLVAQSLPSFVQTMKGFVCFGERVSTGTVMRFMTMVGIGSTAYLSMISGNV